MTTTGTLYIVATPIGNLEELSPRASEILRSVECVYAEDTRRSRVLLRYLQADSQRCKSLYEHNETSRLSEVLAILQNGKDLALVSDAGTPSVSDPGCRLVEHVLAAGVRVSPVAGPSALSAALSVAGFSLSNDEGTLYLGFLPTKGKARRAQLQKLFAHRGIVVWFEAPHRIVATLKELSDVQPDRELVVCRELTKMYEEIGRKALREWNSDHGQVKLKGEFTLVLGPLREVSIDVDSTVLDEKLEACLAAGLRPRDASFAVAICMNQSRRMIYRRCQALIADGVEDSTDVE